MITFAPRKRIVLVATALAAALLPAASTTASATSPAQAAHAAHAAPANSCPLIQDRLFAAADQRAEVGRITPTPSWRTNCKQLYRSDSRPPSIVFAEGFHPKDTLNGQYDVEKYVLVNQPSPYVSTTYDHDLYKTWWKSGWNYYIDAPGGVDVNKTIGDTHKYASQVEVAFPGGIERSFIVAVCPVDKVLKIEIMNECQDNPYYQPWRENYPG
ncbi:ADP-ribosyltransferase [Streptomyces sp. NPDC048337]|uniref:ADP-ribosyltransferase n=1 Tax=Streptomyces sp. NPDC048337 TaxID=3365535 RepID=UPI0037248FA8